MSDTYITGPLGPDNFSRGDRALKALVTYRENPSDIDISDPNEICETGEHVVIVPGSTLSYLIADLGHVAQRQGLNFANVLSQGMEHYGADVIEQAWEHNDDWASTLQDSDNYDRAIAVLRSAGVPEVFDDAIMRKVGLLPSLPQDEEDRWSGHRTPTPRASAAPQRAARSRSS